MICFSLAPVLHAQTDSTDFDDDYSLGPAPLPLGMDFEFGMSVPTGKEAFNLYPLGAQFELGPKVGMLTSQRLWLKLLGGVRWLGQNMDGFNGNEMQHFLSWYSGAEFTYQFQKNNLFLYPILRINYNWSRNFSSYTEDAGTDYSNTTYSYTYIRGKDWSPELGLRLQIRTGYLKLSYNLYRPELRLSDRVINDDHMAGYHGIERQRINFSTINIGIGYDLFIQ
ncbi:hypothetical protein [Olivibacter sitiensis]|uniref:hypothetical protein n=1 Tax=Olivibacter sitiensis TaxID=376470 RepID=UPI0003F82116|nr:hypothetical protein [Olivibacter sitiensis]